MRQESAVDGTWTGADGSATDRLESPPDSTTKPSLICLCASEEDQREVRDLLAASEGTASIDARELDAAGIASMASSRRAILVGPDAAAAIVLGRIGSSHNGPPVIELQPREAVHAGGQNHSPERNPTGPLAESATPHDRTVLRGLTRRESEVAQLVGHGLNVGEIAVKLGREKTTVISHRRSLLRKIGCRDALGIARFAYRTGLATP